jgi:DNA-binding NarL/FixJ family response regulator
MMQMVRGNGNCYADLAVRKTPPFFFCHLYLLSDEPMTTTPSKTRILIVEDDQEIRHTYSVIINGSPKYEVVNAYASCHDAIRNLFTDHPDIVLMDIELPGMNGIQGTRVIKERFPKVEVIMVTVHEDNDWVYQALKAGASGYITKSSNYHELLSALNEIVKGGAPISSHIARRIVEDFHLSTASPLSKRETEVLSLISQCKTYTQISEELLISKQTAKTFIKNIYAKLQVNSKAEAIAKATREKLI